MSVQINMDDVCVAIPAYNEEKRIQSTLEDLRVHGVKHVVVACDGCTDNTALVAIAYNNINKDIDVRVLNRNLNRGYGYTLFEAMTSAYHAGHKYVITFDADGQHQAKDIEEMLLPLDKGYYVGNGLIWLADVTIGSRFLGKKSNAPFKRKVVLQLGRIVHLFLCGVWLTDTHNGFKAFNCTALSKIHLTFDDGTAATEIIGEIKKHNLKYKEVPVEVKYSDDTLEKGIGGISNGMKIVLKYMSRGWSRSRK